MIGGRTPLEIERFRGAVARRLGLRTDAEKLRLLGDVLARRLRATGLRQAGYLAALERGDSPAEISALAMELTVPETYFLRHDNQFKALVETALPSRMARETGARSLHILSAGCSSGEEAYSIAMQVRETVDPSWQVSILGVDINAAALKKAAGGRYSAWSLREVTPQTQKRWFHAAGAELVLDECVRDAVRFEFGNLAEDDPVLWAAGAYDVVFCRNVLMYFTADQMQAAVDRIARALKPGGFLFLGHAETLRGVSSDFHLRHTHDAFYYERKQDARLRSADPEVSDLERSIAVSWSDAISVASARVETLVDAAQPAPAPSARPVAVPAATWQLDRALDLLRAERFDEALAAVDSLPNDARREPAVLLLRAVLYTHRGQFARAEAVCAELLAVDGLSAGAHYVLALCREGAHDREGAIYHDEVALYLDPSFAMPQLHLGLLSRRSGDHQAARRQLAEALRLLEREDDDRVLLFGGGFGKSALLALCRSEAAAGRRQS